MKQTEGDALQMAVVEDHVDMVGMCTIRVGGTEGNPSWNFSMGDPVEVEIEGGQLFSGEVIALEPGFQIEGTASMTIRAMDKSHRLGRGTKTRFWNDMKDSDVAQEVGGECGLSVEADDTSEVMPYILQRNESNMVFLKRLAARNNFQLRVSEGKLMFTKPSYQGNAAQITMGENLRAMRMSFNSSEMVQQVIVRGWNPTDKAEVVGTASAGDVTSIGGGEVGAQSASVFGETTAFITDVPVSSQAQANAIAKAEMERYARQYCRGSATMRGDPAVLAGTMVEFAGLPSGQNGNFYVIATRHIISTRTGYTTEVTFCSNTMGS
ncbi:MAG: contractile injection system protein, VgrG/Pvc8 family [Myxococcota bacterium]